MKGNFKSNFSKSAIVVFLILSLVLLNAVIASTASRFLGDRNVSSKVCGTYNGYTLNLGSGKAGCFYIGDDSKPVFVNKRLCNCNL